MELQSGVFSPWQLRRCLHVPLIDQGVYHTAAFFFLSPNENQTFSNSAANLLPRKHMVAFTLKQPQEMHHHRGLFVVKNLEYLLHFLHCCSLVINPSHTRVCKDTFLYDYCVFWGKTSTIINNWSINSETIVQGTRM